MGGYRRWRGLVAIVIIAGCGSDAPGPAPRGGELVGKQRVSEVAAPLSGAWCEVIVEGVGALDLETDYLPNVVRCENGGANLEALKAQAIAARSVAYYAMETTGSICDGQGCQVYSCGGAASEIHQQAVQETSGMYLKYGDILTYGFYVAGDPNVSAPSCVGAPQGGPTENFVTYNAGNVGLDVVQTTLGFVFDPADSGYGQNRGCMSQWSARCLENDNGQDFVDILRFFYGEDIEIAQTQGACVLDVDLPGARADGTSGEPPGTTAAPAEGDGSGTLATAGRDGGASGLGSTSAPAPDGGGAGRGTGPGPGSAALPDTFGGDPYGGGCGCRTPVQAPIGRFWAVGLVLALLGVRRRGGAVCTRKKGRRSLDRRPLA